MKKTNYFSVILRVKKMWPPNYFAPETRKIITCRVKLDMMSIYEKFLNKQVQERLSKIYFNVFFERF